VTDVEDGPQSANAGAARQDERESFSTATVGKPEVNHPGWVSDDLLSAGGQSGSADRPDAEALTLSIRPPAWASRRMGSSRPITPESAAPATETAPRREAPRAPVAKTSGGVTQPLPTRMLRVATTPQAPGADKSTTARTEMLRVLPPKAPTAAQPEPLAPPNPTFTPTPTLTPKAGPRPPAPSAPPGPVLPGPVLPVPPSDDEKFQYVRRNAWILTLFSVASFPLLLFSQSRLMLQYHWFWVYSPFVVLAALFLALPLLTDGLSRKFDFDEHRRLVKSWRPDVYPSVDVFLPVCGEPVDVLRNTWKYVAAMSEHYQGTVTPYVLDDSHSPELKQMAREFGFAYATRPNRGWFKKSGNLWFGYQVSYGDYILLLDADFAPRHDLLDETLPYMETYPDTGIVQTPQFFRITDDQTWIERGAGAVQELFYRSIQPARSRKGGSICVGSCAVYRRKALADNLGMTLAEHSEDVLTGFDLNSKGWRLRYIPVALSTGNCPDNVLAFLNQQYRWCSGTVGLLFGKRFWGAKLPPYTRMCYISGLVYYIYTALFTFLVPALTIAILVFVPNVLLLKNMIFMVPVVLYSAVIIPSWHHAPFRLEAWAVRVIAGWAHLFAYWDAARGKRLGWKPSGGDKKKQDGRRRFWACFIVWTVGSSLVWTGLAFWRMITMNPYNFIVLFGLGLFELVIAVRVLLQPATDGHA
jgi:cellulose synthase (UDP-forming)